MLKNKQVNNIYQTENKTGKKIVASIVIVSVFLMVLGNIIAIIDASFGLDNIIEIAIFSIFCYKLYNGKPWAKMWYIIATGISAFISLLLIYPLIEVNATGFQLFTIWCSMISIVIRIVCSCLLYFSKSVNEFLDGQLVD